MAISRGSGSRTKTKKRRTTIRSRGSAGRARSRSRARSTTRRQNLPVPKPRRNKRVKPDTGGKSAYVPPVPFSNQPGSDLSNRQFDFMYGMGNPHSNYNRPIYVPNVAVPGRWWTRLWDRLNNESEEPGPPSGVTGVRG